LGDNAIPAKTTGKTTGKAAVKKLQLLDLIRDNPTTTIPEMASILNLTPDGVNYHLKILQKQGVLKRVGSRKQGLWEVVKND